MEAAMTAILLRLGQVEQATGLKKSAIYAKIKARAGSFRRLWAGQPFGRMAV